MTADPAAAYDVSTRDGFLRRVTDVTDRRIPPRYRHAAPTDPAVMAWCDSFTEGNARSLLILGVTGAGKTYQAYGALRELATRGITAQWAAITAPDLYATLRPREGTDSETEFRRYADVPLLLLDDLGAAKGSEWTEEVTYRLIGHRYDAMTPCLITSNVPTDQLRAVLGDRVASRLAEMCQRVILRGTDRRRTGS
jgi:DNA replication protein DnaC